MHIFHIIANSFIALLVLAIGASTPTAFPMDYFSIAFIFAVGYLLTAIVAAFYIAVKYIHKLNTELL